MKTVNILKGALLFFLILCTLVSASCGKSKTDGPSASPNDPSVSVVPSENPTNSAVPSTPADETPESVLPSVSPEQPDGPFEIFLSDASGKAGEEITVSLKFKNNPTIAGYSVTVVYDPAVLTFVRCENQVKGGYATSNSTVSGKVRVMCTVWGGNALSQNGTTDLLTFKINSDTSATESDLQLILADSADSAFIIEEDKTMPSVDCTLSGAKVTIVG